MYKCPDCGKEYEVPPKACECESFEFVFHEPQYFIVEAKQPDLEEYLSGVATIDELKARQIFEVSQSAFDQAVESNEPKESDFYIISEDYHEGVETEDEIIIEYRKISEATFVILIPRSDS